MARKEEATVALEPPWATSAIICMPHMRRIHMRKMSVLAPLQRKAGVFCAPKIPRAALGERIKLTIRGAYARQKHRRR
eukprot:6161288-Pleurochrysis_carterae.AAC.1